MNIWPVTAVVSGQIRIDGTNGLTAMSRKSNTHELPTKKVMYLPVIGNEIKEGIICVPPFSDL